MKKKTLKESPYEKISDDTKRKLKPTTGRSLDHLDTLPDTAKGDSVIPFPYGKENAPDLKNS